MARPSAVMRAVTQLSDKTHPALALRAWRIEMTKATLRLRAKGAARLQAGTVKGTTK